jgi:hypothetical protein
MLALRPLCVLQTIEVLGIDFRDPAESLIDTAESSIRAGLIEDKTPGKEYTGSGAKAAKVTPTINVEGIRPSDLVVTGGAAAAAAAAGSA